jgi:hypothetical protein
VAIFKLEKERKKISIKRLTPKIPERISPLLDAAGGMLAAC